MNAFANAFRAVNPEMVDKFEQTKNMSPYELLVHELKNKQGLSFEEFMIKFKINGVFKTKKRYKEDIFEFATNEKIREVKTVSLTIRDAFVFLGIQEWDELEERGVIGGDKIYFEHDKITMQDDVEVYVSLNDSSATNAHLYIR